MDNLGKVTATATRIVRGASSVEQTTVRELFSRPTTIVARTSATAGTAAAQKNFLAGRMKATATKIPIVLATSSAAKTTVPGGKLSRMMTTAA